MAKEEATIDQVGDDISQSTSVTVEEIGANMSDVAGGIGSTLKESALNALTNVFTAPKPEDIPVPDVTPPSLPEEKSHEALQRAAEVTAPHVADNETTMHEQIEQAKAQFEALG